MAGYNAGTDSMAEHTAKRPAAITIIGLSFLSPAILIILYGSVSIVGLRWLQRAVNTDLYVPPEEFPPVLTVIFNNSEAFQLVTILHIGLAVLLLAVAISFLRLKAWARLALEVVSWVGLFYTGLQAIVWPFIWSALFAGVKFPQPTSSAIGLYGPFSLIAGIVLLAATIISMIVVIRHLRSTPIRNAMN